MSKLRNCKFSERFNQEKVDLTENEEFIRAKEKEDYKHIEAKVKVFESLEETEIVVVEGIKEMAKIDNGIKIIENTFVLVSCARSNISWREISGNM